MCDYKPTACPGQSVAACRGATLTLYEYLVGEERIAPVTGCLDGVKTLTIFARVLITKCRRSESNRHEVALMGF